MKTGRHQINRTSQETCRNLYDVDAFGGKACKQITEWFIYSHPVIKSGRVRIYLCMAVMCSFAGTLMAQKDTVLLAPVVIKGFLPERFMSGLKVQKIDSSTLQQFHFRTLTDLLSVNTPIYFRNYGPGQLATIAFRGTSSSHTAVLWNGLNINLPTLGQTDFSTISVAGFDQLSVQYGSSASAVGTDAVGGSILLGSSAAPAGLQITLGRQQESFNNNQTQLSVKYGVKLANDWLLSYKTTLYNSRINNHFPYTQRQGTDIVPSRSFQTGLVQDLFFGNNKHQFSAHVWLTSNDLTMNPDNPVSRELTRIGSYRTMVRYEIKDWSFRISRIRDIIDYGTGDYSALDHAVTDRTGARAERAMVWKVGKSGSFIHIQAGGEFTHYKTQVAGYERPVITENRADLFILSRWQATSKFLVSLNVRQAFVTGYNPPFTPSLGAEYELIRKGRDILKLKGSLGRSYRVPTLNERYWKNLGNPDIRPESGFNKEIGLEEKHTGNGGHSFTASVTAFHNRINDWTYWNPMKNFHVENLQLVVSKGLESLIGWNYRQNQWQAGSHLNYALTRSSQERVYDAYAIEIVGKQLPHIPVHYGTFVTYVQFKKWRLTNQVQAVSQRFFTSDHTQVLPGYLLYHIMAETTFDLNKLRMQVQGRINNLTNTFYHTLNGNAMPGRSFALNLVVSYRNLNRQ